MGLPASVGFDFVLPGLVGVESQSLALGRDQRWLGFFGQGDKWTDCCTFPLWKEQIRCEDRDETIPLRSRLG